MFQMIHLRKLLLSLGITLGTGFLAGILTQGQQGIYQDMLKPPLSPPGWVFGVVWGILYLAMGVALYFIWKEPQNARRDQGLRLYAVQLFVNFCWPLLFFNLQWYGASAFWLGLLVILVALCFWNFYQQNKTAGWLFLPYLLWCIFALYLNVGVYFLNH